MAVALVARKLLPDDKKLFIQGVVPPEEVIRMVTAYRERMNAVQAAGQASGKLIIKPEDEPLALVLERKAIELVMSQKGCGDLVALFSIDGHKHTNTVILMGLDQSIDKNLLKDDTGIFGRAEETWPARLALTDEHEFNTFFDIRQAVADDGVADTK